MCVFQRARPKSDQEENELVMTSLRNLYEERQRSHQHTLSGESKQVSYFTSLMYICTLPTLCTLIMSYISSPVSTIMWQTSLSRRNNWEKKNFLDLVTYYSCKDRRLCLTHCLAFCLCPCACRCVKRQVQPQWRRSSRVAVGSGLNSSRAVPSALSLSPWRGSGR